MASKAVRDAINNLRPKKGSGIDSVTISSGGRSATLNADSSKDSHADAESTLSSIEYLGREVLEKRKIYQDAKEECAEAKKDFDGFVDRLINLVNATNNDADRPLLEA